ncbi:MAG: hypothetical protein IPN90_03590 [Elusimicrobia bacterium]|nr:hypothetical protein [Elusimicrobiota bacterium]
MCIQWRRVVGSMAPFVGRALTGIGRNIPLGTGRFLTMRREGVRSL